ncbi:MAG: magnesium transporter [Pseudomonadota bacterium]
MSNSSLSHPKKHLTEALDLGSFHALQTLLHDMPAADISHFIESSPPRYRALLWRLIDPKQESEVLSHLNEEIRAEYLKDLDAATIAQLMTTLEADDLVDVLQELPAAITEQILASFDEQRRQRIQHVLSYDEDTAGGLLNTDSITIRPNITLEVVSRYLRRHTALPETTDHLIVIDRQDVVIGTLPISTLLVSDPNKLVKDVMRTEFTFVTPNVPAFKVAQLFERRDLISLPVLDLNGKLLGRITIDDVVDVIRNEGAHSLMSMAGLDEAEDTFAPVVRTSQRRAFWLGMNLLTALAASAVIDLFEVTLAKIVALAVLMPIVASMGGVAGNQTLTLVIRGMALGQLHSKNFRWFLMREMGVAAINGLVWAVVVGMTASVWFSDISLGLIIAAAMMINLMCAAIAGSIIPAVLKRMRVDPALAGSVVLTTVTDIVGFFSFLGLASLVYL